MKKKLLIFIILVLNIFLLCSCYNYSDVEDVVVVAGMSVDISDDGRYNIAVEILSATSSDEISVNSETIIAEGRTIYEAIEDLSNSSGKLFNFSHCQVIFISEKLAYSGIRDVIDLVFHYNRIRLSTILTVVSGNSASSVFECKIPLYDALSYGVFDMMKHDRTANAIFPSSQVYISLNSLENKGKEMIIPMIKIVDGDVKQCQFSGVTVFHEDKAVGTISEEQSRDFMILMGKLSDMEITLPFKDGYASLEIKDLSISRHVEEDLKNFNEKLDMLLTVRQLPDGYDISSDEDRTNFENEINDKMEKEFHDLFLFVRDNFNSDIFGLGSQIYHTKPTEWKKIGEDWDKLFKETELNIEVSCKINDAGRSSKDIVPDRR